MITERSSRTMIRWIRVGGPAPRRWATSAPPEGWSILKATSIVLPGCTAPVGWKPARWKVRAAPIVGAAGVDEDEEQPATTATTQARPIAVHPRSARTGIR